MGFVWMQGNAFTQIATIYNANITLNTPCIPIFNGARWCLIGLDRPEKKVAIRLVSNEELSKNTYPQEILNKVSIGKSYVRISNKAIVKEISKIVDKKCEGEKFLIEYDENNQQIIINLSQNVT
ncbi:MAG: hypothetical protein Q4F88_02860 [Eubacteriales bacterium]|nr:hypothetical protein [Eubacteriales bacterium]